MIKLSFLANLLRKEVIGLVEPSEEIKQSYIEKSASNIDSAKILLKNNKLEESVALSYYSMYHFVTALFFKAGIKSENHNATIQMLNDIFDIDNREITWNPKKNFQIKIIFLEILQKDLAMVVVKIGRFYSQE
jgi:hypothetical protein